MLLVVELTPAIKRHSLRRWTQNSLPWLMSSFEFDLLGVLPLRLQECFRDVSRFVVFRRRVRNVITGYESGHGQSMCS
jgi:hypothetical protein